MSAPCGCEGTNHDPARHGVQWAVRPVRVTPPRDDDLGVDILRATDDVSRKLDRIIELLEAMWDARRRP